MKLLYSEKVPYLLVMLFGATAWLITHTVDRLLLSPYIEYRVEQNRIGNFYVHRYQIINITKDKIFENLDFLITPENPDSQTIENAKIFYLPPMRRGDSDNSVSDQRHYKCHLSYFQPNCSIVLSFRSDKNKEIPLRYSSKSAVLLQKSNIQTCVIRNETSILVVLIILIFILACIYVYNLNSSKHEI